MSTTRYKPDTIILIPFPFTDLSTVKQRPALVVSSSKFNETHRDVIVVAITSSFVKTKEDDEYLLEEKERTRAGLLYPSMVKIGKVVTIDQRLARKTLGILTPRTTRHIVQRIREIIRAE